MQSQPEAFFLPSDPGQRFCLFHSARSSVVHGQVLYIHPFAEEMNKSRRMAALQSRTLAEAGFDVLQIDLLGCGDSSGDFGDATWQSWVNDSAKGLAWLRHRLEERNIAQGDVPLWLWGLRAGCLLAVELGRQHPHACNFLFWQPPSNGKVVLQQLLRLKVAGALQSGQSGVVMERLRQDLASGVSIEISGYRIASDLATGLERSVLGPAFRTGPIRQVKWFEISTRKDASLSPASARTIAEWQEAGYVVTSRILDGPAFWQSNEIEQIPELLEATTGALLEHHPA